MRYLFFGEVYVFCAIFDHHIRMKTKQIRQKKVFPSYYAWGKLNFLQVETKSQLGDAKYRWRNTSLLQKNWPYFLSRVMALFHYYDTATVQNQPQLLTCKTSKWHSLLFEKTVIFEIPSKN